MIDELLKISGLILQMIGVITIVTACAFIALLWIDGRGRDE